MEGSNSPHTGPIAHVPCSPLGDVHEIASHHRRARGSQVPLLAGWQAGWWELIFLLLWWLNVTEKTISYRHVYLSRRTDAIKRRSEFPYKETTYTKLHACCCSSTSFMILRISAVACGKGRVNGQGYSSWLLEFIPFCQGLQYGLRVSASISTVVLLTSTIIPISHLFNWGFGETRYNSPITRRNPKRLIYEEAERQSSKGFVFCHAQKIVDFAAVRVGTCTALSGQLLALA